jgi:signal peptidase
VSREGLAPYLSGEGAGALRILKVAVVAAVLLEGYLVVALAFGTLTPFMVVPSTSMVPTLNVGDLIVVRGVDATTVAPGDIIVFNVPSPYDSYTPSPVVHRVVDVRIENGKLAFVTQGDNLPSPDSWLVPAENVIGVCVGRVPYLGLPALFLRTPYGIAAVAAIIMLLIFLPRRRKGARGEGVR